MGMLPSLLFLDFHGQRGGDLIAQLAGDGVGDLNDVYIESVIFKGEHNEIILESDNQKKWVNLPVKNPVGVRGLKKRIKWHFFINT